MTEQEKQGTLESFEALRQMAENQDNSAQFQTNADMLLAAAGDFPLPYVNAVAGELEKVSQAKETKSTLLAKLTVGIDFIKSTPAEQLSHELIKAQMDNA